MGIRLRNGRLRLGLGSAVAFACAFSLLAPSPWRAWCAEAKAGPRAIVIGWDGADWELLDSLVSEGRLPNLARLLERGRSWNLATFEPMVSPMIWTTIATGRTPTEHGVLDFQELDLKTGKRIPIGGRSRRVPAIWNVASANGVAVGVVSWWATWPAERVSGFLVSDRASSVLFDPATLRKSPGLAWPDGLSGGVRLVARREGAPGFEDVAQALRISEQDFALATSKQPDEPGRLTDPIPGYRRILGATRVTARLALDLYDRERPGLLMVYFQGTDEIGHLLGAFHPPKLGSIDERDFARLQGGVAGLYAEADRILGEFARRAARDRGTLILLSDHGFRWRDDRPAGKPGTQFDTAFLWHRSPGVLAAQGPTVAPSRTRGTASVFDIGPTLTRLLGLPPDPRFEGRVAEGFRVSEMPPFVASVSWEKSVPVERVLVNSDEAFEASQRAGEALTQKLRSLGYLGGHESGAIDSRPPGNGGTETAAGCQNLATFLRERGQLDQAVAWYRKALAIDPRSATAFSNLSITFFRMRRWDEADEALCDAIQAGLSDPAGAVARRSEAYAGLGRKRPEDGPFRIAFLSKVLTRYPEDRYRVLLGRARFEARECREAERIFAELVSRLPKDVEAINMLALSRLCLGEKEDARQLFQRSLSIKPDQPAIGEGLRRIGAAPAPSSRSEPADADRLR